MVAAAAVAAAVVVVVAAARLKFGQITLSCGSYIIKCFHVHRKGNLF